VGKFVILTALLGFIIGGCGGKNQVETYKFEDTYGVWADAETELVRTGRFSIIFEKRGEFEVSALSTISYMNDSVIIDKRGEAVFDTAHKAIHIKMRDLLKGDSLLVEHDSLGMIELSRNVCAVEKIKNRLVLKVNGDVIEEYYPVEDRLYLVRPDGTRRELERVEKLTLAEAYDMPTAKAENIGECLQRWQLGTGFQKHEEGFITGITVNTNRHSYIFYYTDNMIYCRAARLRHNNNGSLFAQNIRMMYNNREFTASMPENNLTETSAEVEIVDSLFDPKICVFAENGIYWSVKDYTSDEITLNGCGQEYFIKRHDRDSNEILEWFEYDEY